MQVPRLPQASESISRVELRNLYFINVPWIIEMSFQVRELPAYKKEEPRLLIQTDLN